MKHGPLQIRLQMLLRRFERDENGTTVVELAVVMPLFLLLFFGLIDFGRMAFHYVTAEKAMQVAARVAAACVPAEASDLLCACCSQSKPTRSFPTTKLHPEREVGHDRS